MRGMTKIREMTAKIRLLIRDAFYAIGFQYQVHPYLFVTQILIQLARTLVGPATIVLAGKVVDLLTRRDLRQALWLLLVYGLLLLLSTAMDYISRAVSDVLADLVKMKVSKTIAEMLQGITSLEIYHSKDYHDSITALHQIESAMRMTSSGFIDGTAGVIGYILVAATTWAINPHIPLIIGLTMIPQGIVQARMMHLQYQGLLSMAPEKRKLDYLRHLMLDDAAAKEVKFFGVFGYLKNLHNSTYQETFAKQDRIHRKRSLASLLSSSLALVGTGAGIVLGVGMVFSGKASIGELTRLFSAVWRMSSDIASVMLNYGYMAQNSIYMERLRGLLSSIAERTEAKPSSPRKSCRRIETIEVENVYFVYPGTGTEVLRGVSLTLKRGDTLAIVGLNGAGKTTLSKLLMGLYSPTKGSIKVNGIDLSDYDPASVRSRISCLFQDFTRYLLSFRDNIAMGSGEAVPVEAIQRALHLAEAWDLVQEKGGLDAELGKPFGGTDLSGGEWQRIALARALVRESDVLVLDEPSSALDPEAEYKLYLRFQEISKDKITILISHRFTTVKMATRIVVLSGGRIVEEGSHRDLLRKNGFYAEMYRHQAERYEDSSRKTTVPQPTGPVPIAVEDARERREGA